MSMRPIVLLGPTGGGKSELAVALAERLDRQNGQIISADSMQVYRHLDAGTAKPPPHLRGRVPHHLIDLVEPTERFTVADWLQRADALIERLLSQQVRPIVVGGTNLYIKALLEGLFDGPPHDPELRAQLAALPAADLHERLEQIDPAAAERIHPNDRKRLTRALEVFELTGKPISQWQQQWQNSAESPARYRHDPILIGLDWPVEEINKRINARVKQMFYPAACGFASESLPDETRRLEASNLLGPQAREALGYKQVLDWLGGRCTLDQAFEQTKILTRRFAKQQRTWLRRFVGVRWLAAAELSPTELASRAVQMVQNPAEPR
ncbi:MAG: tRNA (adenosine(37)-N6)-dimethylallyltransferase MiaA [Phycisphaeraceae bacterium]